MSGQYSLKAFFEETPRFRLSKNVQLVFPKAVHDLLGKFIRLRPRVLKRD
jgi:hypothetical protein